MSARPAIEFHDVYKYFPRLRGQMLIRRRLAGMLAGRHKERFCALSGVSFEVYPGESMAVIGPNGAGKSTLLGLVAGLAEPNSGTVRVEGRVAALLELGSGFHTELTGAENVRLNAAILGLTRKETAARFDKIVEFSEIGDFIDQPLRTYSSGMMMRLAFSVAINTDPEIMLVDEILAVGDQAFQAKCFERIHELRRRGTTMLCVSHSPAMVQAMCDRAIWLEQGALVMAGDASEVAAAYAGGVRAG
jgi:ABC-type polysaccharide/polyol phosphate transport system ATPase subunit